MGGSVERRLERLERGGPTGYISGGEYWRAALKHANGYPEEWDALQERFARGADLEPRAARLLEDFRRTVDARRAELRARGFPGYEDDREHDRASA